MARKSQEGRCRKCGANLDSIFKIGLCPKCRRAEAGSQHPEYLRKHPDLLEVERVMEEFQQKWDGEGPWKM